LAGRPSFDTVEVCPALDVRALSRDGVLQTGTHEWFWRAARITLALTYRQSTGTLDLEPDRLADARIQITYTEPNFGGTRPWFLCPEAAEDASRNCTASQDRGAVGTVPGSGTRVSGSERRGEPLRRRSGYASVSAARRT